MNLLKFTLFFLLLSTPFYAQKKNDYPTPEEIKKAEKLREIYSKDDVAVLESDENISFGYDKRAEKVTVSNTVKQTLININQRADIYKYEFYDSESKIETFSLTNRIGKPTYFTVTDEFYKDNDLFYNDAHVKHMSVNFPVQGYSYIFDLEKKYNDVKYFTSLYFNDEYPVINKTITIIVPNWLNLELKEFNFEGNKIIKSKKADPKNNATIYTYNVKDLAATNKDSNSPGRSYLYPHIVVIAKSYTKDDKQTMLFNTTADLYKWYKSLVNLMKDDVTLLQEKVKELTANAKTDDEKIRNIYYWVQDNIRYIAFEDGIAGFKPDESDHVFQKRYGDCKGMANLIKQMLKAAGFDARLTWIGTKHIAYDYTTPSLSVDNHMICTLFHKGKKYFLDGTEKFNSLGNYAERIQNKEVMIEDGEKFIIDKIPKSNSGTNKETISIKLSIENEKLKGTSSRSYLGESCAQFLNIYSAFGNDKKRETLDNFLSLEDKNITVSNIKSSDFKNRDKKLTIDYGIELENKVSRFDNDIYIDLEFMNEYKLYEFKDRKTDYQFDYKIDYDSMVSLQIPDGYKIAKIPENLTIKETDYEINITFVQNANEIIYKKTFDFKNAVIPFSGIEKWRGFIKNLNNIYNQQITLSKI